MGVKVYADDTLIYDSACSAASSLCDLTASVGLNVSGTAEMVLPPKHKHINDFTSYRTIVRIYRNSDLIFRGRALYQSDDLYCRRTVMCEGERGFLRDTVVRRYSYDDTPSNIFATLITAHNAQVDTQKRFTLGRVTVTSTDGGAVQIASDDAVYTSDAIDSLVSLCGGYITFDHASDGTPTINWLADASTDCNQTLEFGRNLIDVAKTDVNEDFCTAIVPFGCPSALGGRITIAIPNGGVDYIYDAEAVAKYGFIAKTIIWDSCAMNVRLLALAREELARRKVPYSSITLTAVDLSTINQNIDSFTPGSVVRAISAPHALDAYFTASERTYDLINPSSDTITFGNKKVSLTSSSATQTKAIVEAVNNAASAVEVQSASATHTHSAADIVSGALSIARGGTGQSTAVLASAALGRGYSVCTTAATTAAKTAVLSSFSLSAGAVVAIKFSYANTATAPTLNVNSSGAKYIYSAATGTYATAGELGAMVHYFTYNGAQWVLLNPLDAFVQSGDWTYCKRANGVLEMWLRASSGSKAITSAIGSIFYCPTATLFNLPTTVSFIDTPALTISTNNVQMVWVSGNITSTYVEVWPMSATSKTATIDIDIHLAGRWK